MDLPTVTIRRIVITKLEAMKYFYDCEFLEGTQRRGLFGRRQTNPTIDLISIGIVAEDGREYYAVSKEFNLKEAWNRYDEKEVELFGDQRNHAGERFVKKRVYWIRENVLKPIFKDLYSKHCHLTPVYQNCSKHFTYSGLKFLIETFGKTRNQIADDVKYFCDWWRTLDRGWSMTNHPIEFYGYYSAYDHVALCWLFGKMMDLPKGFPMYTRDLKQVMDDKQRYRSELLQRTLEYKGDMFDSEAESERYKPEIIKDHPLYPKQTNEHNALADAKWNKELYEFLKTV